VLALLLLLASAPEPAARTKTTAVLRNLVASNQPGLAVLVRRGGRTVFEQANGIRDLRTRAPIGVRTDFRLASVTKQLTAAAIVLLVRDGRLRYDEPLTEALPGFPPYGQAITIRHLLTHTSGLPDYEQLMDAAEKRGATAWTSERQIRDDQVLGLLKQATKGSFEPGGAWAYSNSGFVVLGLVAARAAGRPFPDVLRERIFVPLGMTHTLAFVRGTNEVPERALGHARTSEGFLEADQSSTSATLGDGGVYSCLEDLAKWDEALGRGSLLTAAESKQVFTPARLADGSEPHWPSEPGDENLFPGRPVSYGFGWFLDPWQGRPRTWHHGETKGFRATIQRFPDAGLTVVLLANRDDLDLQALALRIAEAQLGP
jgi:CubicO group peptidase (beta-lactamase class C family)